MQDQAIEASAARDWVEHELLACHGTANQLERWESNLLPEGELLALARNVLFAPFKEFRRWSKINAEEMQHDRSCTGGTVTFVTHEPSDLDANEWSMFKAIRTAANAENIGAVVSLVEHVGRCSVCPAEVFGRSASIRIEWAGRPLSREYSLEAL